MVAYDHRNRLTGLTFKTSAGTVTKSVAYTYDARDRRLIKAVDDGNNGSTTTMRPSAAGGSFRGSRGIAATSPEICDHVSIAQHFGPFA